MDQLYKTDDETRKDLLINEFIKMGIFKRKNLQLFELSLSELEEEYQKVQEM